MIEVLHFRTYSLKSNSSYFYKSLLSIAINKRGGGYKMAKTTTAKYEKISQWIKDKILDGSFPVGTKIPSENELSVQFGYSRQTVRQAIGILEADGYLIRSKGSGTYVHRPHRRLNEEATMRIGVITTYLDDYVFPGIIHGIEEVLSENRYSMSLGITHNKQADEENCLRQMLENGVDGLIVEGTKSALPNVNGMLYREIADRGIPIVFINGYYRDYCDSYVVMDDIKAGENLMDLLISKGHKKIGGIFKSDDIQGLKRYEGMQKSAKRNNISIQDNAVIWYTTEDFTYLFDGSLDEAILTRLNDVSAVICYNDQTAVALIKLLAKYSFRIPRDYSIVSFDNSFLADEGTYNLTSVIYPSQEIGRKSAELILKRVNRPDYSEKIVLKPVIEERSSIKILN